MKISYEFLEQILEVPAIRLSAFSQLLNAAGEIGETAELRAVVAYSHLLKYSPPELAGLLVAKIFAKHADAVDSIAVVNKSAVVSNGEILWDIQSAKEADAAKLAGIYEQHGVDLVVFVELIEETFKDVEKKREQRRTAGAQRGAVGPPPSGAPGVPSASPPGPGSASPQP